MRADWGFLVGCLMSLYTMPATSAPAPHAARMSDRGVSVVEGVASWYGWFHDGHPMANGQPFRALGITAASPWIPLGTRVRVTNLGNGRSVVLIITDRGPYVDHRILDLSLGAARYLHMEEAGLAWVRIELHP